MLQVINSIDQASDGFEVYKIDESGSLGNYYLNSQNLSYPRAINLYTKGLIRNLLLRDPQTEIEFRQVPYEGYILCDHYNLHCQCKVLASVKNIVGSAPSHEEGLYILAKKYYPAIDINYRQELMTHINICKNSKSTLGRLLWDFLHEKFTVSQGGQYTTILELTGSLFHNKGAKGLPTVIENGSVINNSSVIKTIIEEHLEKNHDLIAELFDNTLPLTMYETVKYKDGKGPRVDIDDTWISDTITEAVDNLKKKKYPTLASILEDKVKKYEDQ